MDSRHLATSLIKARPGTSLNYNLGAFPSDMQQFMSQSLRARIPASRARQQRAGNLTMWHTLFQKACQISKHKSKGSKSVVLCCPCAVSWILRNFPPWPFCGDQVFELLNSMRLVQAHEPLNPLDPLDPLNPLDQTLPRFRWLAI